MSKVGILGGTFDPIHAGHLITAQSVKEIRSLDKIIFVPAFISPHKTDIRTAGAEHRLNMLKLAIQGIEYYEWSDIEIKAESVSYTVETLKYFKNKFEHLELIIGYDNLIKFDTWKEPDEIIKLAALVVMKRNNTEEPKVKNKYFESAVFVDSPVVEISSSVIRERISNNLPVDFLVPLKVNKYIKETNLYKEQ